MRLFFLTGLLVVLALTFANAETKMMNWDDTTRDVYIDGQLDRDAQVLYPAKGKQLVMFSAKLKQAVLLDTAAGTVNVIDKSAFNFSNDRATATASVALSPKPAGKYTKIHDSIYHFAVEGKAILINRHEGALGEITEEKLWEIVPTWKSLLDNYRPNPDSVATLKNINEDTQLTVILGTWCHDSKDHVPRFLKAVQVANNKHLRVKLIALDRGFSKSTDKLQRYQITNTPTFIVERNGHELGRINETPAVPLVEDDLVAILNGKPNVHHGSGDHGPQLAQGSYQYRNREGRETGTERWQLYSTDNDGRLIHSEIVQGDLRTETYYEIDNKKRPVFVEITIRQGDRIIRERAYTEKNDLDIHITGDAGVLDQFVDFPERAVLSSPAVAAEMWGGAAVSDSKDGGSLSRYVALSDFDNLGGFVDKVDYEAKGEESIHTPAGDFRAKQVIQKTGTESRKLYAHPNLGIPVMGDLKDGGSFVLTSLEISSASR